MKTNFNTTAAPKNGTVIHARGKVMIHEDACTIAEPFEALIFWRAENGFAGWMFHDNRLSVARTLDDIVIIHEWRPLFQPVAVGAASVADLSVRGYRAQMRSYALRFREAIHPKSYGTLEQRADQGMHFIGLAMSYRNFASDALAGGYQIEQAA